MRRRRRRENCVIISHLILISILNYRAKQSIKEFQSKMIDKIWGYNVDLRQYSMGFGCLKIFQCIMSTFFVIELLIRHKAALSAIDVITIVVTVVGAVMLIQGARFVNLKYKPIINHKT